LGSGILYDQPARCVSAKAFCVAETLYTPLAYQRWHGLRLSGAFTNVDPARLAFSVLVGALAVIVLGYQLLPG